MRGNVRKRTEKVVRSEVDADFLSRLADRRVEKGFALFSPAAGKSHVPGPRIAHADLALDEQKLRTRTKDRSHCGLETGITGLFRQRTDLRGDLVEGHRSKLARKFCNFRESVTLGIVRFSSIVLTRTLVLIAVPLIAATEPPRVRRHVSDDADLSSAVTLSTHAPRAAGFEGGFDLTFHLENGNDDLPPGKPNAWVYVPARFDPEAPLQIVLIFRGFLNCIASYTSPQGIPCTPGHPKRTGYDLPRQIERSGIRALVVLPELIYDQRSSEPGKLAEPGAIKRFLDELLQRMEPMIGKHDVKDAERISFMASSGGFQALEPALEQGGVNPDALLLMDAFYVYDRSAMGRFLGDHLAEYEPTLERPRRFTMLYSPTGGALDRSLGFRQTAIRWVEEAGMENLSNFDASGHPVLGDFRPPIAIVRAQMEHDEVVSTYLWQVLASTNL